MIALTGSHTERHYSVNRGAMISCYLCIIFYAVCERTKNYHVNCDANAAARFLLFRFLVQIVVYETQNNTMTCMRLSGLMCQAFVDDTNT